MMNIKKNTGVTWPVHILLTVVTMLAGYGVAFNGIAWADAGHKTSLKITDTTFTIENHPDDASHWQHLAANIWPLAAGDSFSAETLSAAILALKQSGLFGHIDVSSREVDNTIALIVTLTPFDRIRDIRIRGEYPMFEKEILRVMTIFVGDAYAPGDMPLQTERITALFKQQGYPSPRVSVTAFKSGDPGQVIVRVDIDKGGYLSVGRVVITGNRAVSDLRLQSKMKTWRNRLKVGSAGRFVANDFKKDIQRLTAFYRKSGYVDAVIDDQVKIDMDRQRVDVVLTVSEGSRYAVIFDGNRAFSDRRLKKEMVMFTRGMKQGVAIRESIRHIRDLYSQKGYLKAAVHIDLPAPPSDQPSGRQPEGGIDTEIRDRALRVRIEEGPRTVINSIRITGNQFIPTGKIKAQMLSRPPTLWHAGILDPAVLSEDITAIRTLFIREGFTDVRVEKIIEYPLSPEQADIRLHIDAGVQTRVSAVRFTGLPGIGVDAARNAVELSTGSPFRQYMVTSDENTLSALISENGYPHVRVIGDVQFGRDRQQAEITYRVTPGPQVRVGTVDFTGNFRTRERVLRRIFSQKPNTPFSLKKILRETHALQSMDILDTAHINPLGLEARSETVDLLVNVTERKPYFFEAGSGYATDKGIFAHAKIGDRNLFGLNKSAWVDGTIGQTGHRAAIGFTEPRLLGTRILADLGIHTERIEAFNQTFGTTLHGANLKLSTHPWAPLSLGWGVRYEYRDQFRREPCATPPCDEDPDLFRPRSLLVTSPSMLYDTRDSFIRPHRGIFSTLTVDISKGLQNSLDDFIKYRFDVRAFYTPVKRLTVAVRGQIGYLDTYGSAGQVPDDQLFFLGGIGNIRGFAENRLRFDENGDPVGGRQAVSASLETRFEMGLNLELALFFDTGRISETFEDQDRATFRSSIGGGLRYLTPIGPIGIVYGHKLDPLDGESRGRFHFSIGYAF